MKTLKPAETKEPGRPPEAEPDKKPGRVPAAGPHARRDLTNYDATPGAGSLAGPDDEEGVSS